MKKFILISAVLLSTLTYSQKAYNQFSVDVNYGLALPVTSIPDGKSASDFLGFSHFIIGARYMIIPEIGFKLSYNYGKFQDKNFKENNFSYNKYELQAYSNLVYLFDFQGEFWNKFGLLAHTGGGVTYANPSGASNNERIGNFIIGLTPQYKISKKFALSTDFSYVVTLKQHFDTDGDLINPDYKSESRGYFYFTVGLNYYIGKNGDHADWQ